MSDVDEQLWKLGITAKTQHNEVAPCQHEIAPIFSVSNVALDNNYLVMNVLKKTAKKYGLVCLLHENHLMELMAQVNTTTGRLQQMTELTYSNQVKNLKIIKYSS